ncbi:hypothetical protein N9H39_09680 [Gammaproteobacteria bacterium]|nr:hypothetical protein [Gammaproteobacteria bacterium]
MTKPETYAEIVERVQSTLLTRNGRAHIEKRRAAAEKMAKGLRVLETTGWFLKARRRNVGPTRTVFTARQGSLQQAAKGLQVWVELRGVGVGTLLPPTKGNEYPRLKPSVEEGRDMEWGGNEALEYIRARVENIKPSHERELQGIFVRDMSSSPKHDLLKNLQPVRPARCMMEIPAAVNASGEIRTGNIDILARMREGRSTRYVVCELKVDKTAPYDAMVQAIHYATALDIEVNGIENEIEPANKSVYHFLFGSKSTSQGALRFGAMAIIPNGLGVEGASRKALDDLDTQDAWLDVMLFEWKGKLIPICRLKDGG